MIGFLADLRLRRAHDWTWRWAHHPLCARFRPDVLRVGRLHLCRSCTALWSGLVTTLALCAWPLAALPNATLTVAGAAGLALVAFLSPPRRFARLPRAVRDLVRGAMGALAALVAILVLRGAFLPGGLLAMALIATLLVLRSSRERSRAHRCEGCPELGAGVCSGYALQAEDLRRWESAAVERLARRGFQPIPRARAHPGA